MKPFPAGVYYSVPKCQGRRSFRSVPAIKAACMNGYDFIECRFHMTEHVNEVQDKATCSRSTVGLQCRGANLNKAAQKMLTPSAEFEKGPSTRLQSGSRQRPPFGIYCARRQPFCTTLLRLTQFPQCRSRRASHLHTPLCEGDTKAPLLHQ